jgi:acyl-CoA synthetase (AMP-forming)/AMP-acid ligase II
MFVRFVCLIAWAGFIAAQRPDVCSHRQDVEACRNADEDPASSSLLQVVVKPSMDAGKSLTKPLKHTEAEKAPEDWNLVKAAEKAQADTRAEAASSTDLFVNDHFKITLAIGMIILLVALEFHFGSYLKQLALRLSYAMKDHPVGLPSSQKFAHEVNTSTEFSTWYDLLPDSTSPLIYDVLSRKPLSYQGLREFIKSDALALHRFGIELNSRVCTMIPNGPEAAVCFLGLPTRCVFAPLNPALTKMEIEFEFEDLPCHTLILQAGTTSAVALEVAKAMKVQVLIMTPKHDGPAGIFSLDVHPDSPIQHPALGTDTWASRQDIAMVLHTSGTTKKPKIVPLTHENLVVGALCIKSTLQLSTSDICANVMPLYHIHGISVNVLATALSGASVLCTPGYSAPVDALQWLTNITGKGIAPTWYSAVPTMHQGIVDTGELAIGEGKEIAENLHLIRNCSAALVPVMAERMQKLFACTVLPTYAMTESMPIASNPLPPHLQNLRSVGMPVGPSMKLRCDNGLEASHGSEGEICVQGECVTAGYEFRSHMSEDPNLEGFAEGWLRTGDKGYFDSNGYLCLSGRFKEIINRGGEKISPFEVENVIRKFPSVQDCIAFSVPHEQLGEVVGVVVVLRPKYSTQIAASLLQELRAFAMQEMSAQWAPECLVFALSIPKGSTGKPARIGYAKRMGVPALDATVAGTCVWDATIDSESLRAVTETSAAPGSANGEVSSKASNAKDLKIGNDIVSVKDSLGYSMQIKSDQLLMKDSVSILLVTGMTWVIFTHLFFFFPFGVDPIPILCISLGMSEALHGQVVFRVRDLELVFWLVLPFWVWHLVWYGTSSVVTLGMNDKIMSGSNYQRYWLLYMSLFKSLAVGFQRMRLPGRMQLLVAAAGLAMILALRVDERVSGSSFTFSGSFCDHGLRQEWYCKMAQDNFVDAKRLIPSFIAHCFLQYMFGLQAMPFVMRHLDSYIVSGERWWAKFGCSVMALLAFVVIGYNHILDYNVVWSGMYAQFFLTPVAAISLILILYPGRRVYEFFATISLGAFLQNCIVADRLREEDMLKFWPNFTPDDKVSVTLFVQGYVFACLVYAFTGFSFHFFYDAIQASGNKAIRKLPQKFSLWQRSLVQ